MRSRSQFGYQASADLWAKPWAQKLIDNPFAD